VIHNGQLFQDPRPTRRTVLGIAMRVLDATGRSAVIGDLFRIYTVARRQGASFHWVTIPDGVEMASEEVFDPVSMTALFEVGYRSASAGDAWAMGPPGLSAQPAP